MAARPRAIKLDPKQQRRHEDRLKLAHAVDRKTADPKTRAVMKRKVFSEYEKAPDLVMSSVKPKKSLLSKIGDVAEAGVHEINRIYGGPNQGKPKPISDAEAKKNAAANEKYARAREKKIAHERDTNAVVSDARKTLVRQASKPQPKAKPKPALLDVLPTKKGEKPHKLDEPDLEERQAQRDATQLFKPGQTSAQKRKAVRSLRKSGYLDQSPGQKERAALKQTSSSGGSSGSGHAGAALAFGTPDSGIARIVRGQTKAVVKHPLKTVKGLGEMVTGTVGAAGEVGLPLLDAAGHAATGHPKKAVKDVEKTGRAVKRVAVEQVKDYKYRYGPAFRGDYKTFDKRAEESPASGLVDVASVTLAGAKLARPVTRGVVKAIPGKKGGGKAFLDAPRPKLTVSGGKAVRQDVSHRPLRVAVQRGEDALRERKSVRQDVKRKAAAQRVRENPLAKVGDRDRAHGLIRRKSAVRKSIERHNAKRGTNVAVPVAEREVVGLFPRRTNKRQRVNIGKHSSGAYIGGKHEGTHEIKRGFDAEFAALSKKQRRAIYTVLKGYVPDNATPAVARRHLEERMAQTGPPQGPRWRNRDTEAATLPWLHKHADEIWGDNRLTSFREAEVARGHRILVDAQGEHTPAVRPQTAAKQRRRAQGEFLGVEYEPKKQLKQAHADAVQEHRNKVDERKEAERGSRTADRVSQEKVGGARVLVRQADARALKRDRGYRRAAKALGAATREMRDAKKEFGNAHRNPDLFTTEQRHAAENRAAAAERNLDAAKDRFDSAKTAATTRMKTVIDRRPVRTLNSLEKARGTTVVKKKTVARLKQEEAAALKLVEERKKALDEGPTPEQEDIYHEDYTRRVTAAAEARGLPEPTYFPDRERSTSKPSSYNSSNASRAAGASKRSKMKLSATGSAVISPRVYREGLAATIKPKHQWRAVANAAEDNTMEWSRGPDGKGLTITQLEREIDNRGLRRKDFIFYNPGQVKAAAQATDATKIGDVFHKGGSENPAIVKTDRYFAVPEGAGKELQAMARPQGSLLRHAAAFQGLQSSLILGLNPTWGMMQVAANTLQSTIGTGGRLDRIIRAQAWYKSLTPAERRVVDHQIGIGVYEGSTATPHLGVHQGPVMHGVEQVGQIPVVRLPNGKTVRLTDVDPRKVMFRFDNAQNNFFRRGVFFDQLVRAQKELKKTSKQIHGHDARTQLRNVMESPEHVEKAAEHTIKVLGDYLQYSKRERDWKSFVMFYGFLRYATKTLFYTLPKDHPLTLALGLKLGQLHNEEVRRIFGTRDLPPWVLSRSYEYDDHGKLIRDKQNRPMYRDLARINPISSPITDTISEGPQAIAGMMSPMLQAAFNTIANENVASGRPLQVKGSASKQKHGSFDPWLNIKVAGHTVAASTLPGRLGLGALSHGKTMGDDFSTIKYKTDDAKARDKQRQRDRPSLKQTLSPLTVARPDTTQDYLNRHGHGPDAKVTAEIKKITEKIKALPNRGLDDFDYETQTLKALRERKAVLVERRRQILKKKKPPARGKLRPLTASEKAQSRLERQLNRLEDPGAEARDRLNRQLERAKIAAGG